jgi:hypothetical protein
LVEDIRGFYDWITQVEGFLFPIATKHQIAVLGLDAFEVRNDGLQTVYLADASSYILFTGDWREQKSRPREIRAGRKLRAGG